MLFKTYPLHLKSPMVSISIHNKPYSITNKSYPFICNNISWVNNDTNLQNFFKNFQNLHVLLNFHEYRVFWILFEEEKRPQGFNNDWKENTERRIDLRKKMKEKNCRKGGEETTRSESCKRNWLKRQEQTRRKKDNSEGEEFDFISNSRAFIESPTNSPQFVPNLGTNGRT